MDKWSKAYEELFKQVIPESPLKEAFRKWNETAKQIKEGRKEGMKEAELKINRKRRKKC
jgi:hypothetical protein|tara:strand:- start:377 stop:553 length:177 start_codon:yes stop_codon:yes gene_type:complete